MGRIVDITITCDRCEKPIAKEYEDENEWDFFNYKKIPFYKLSHGISHWTQVDEFLLCNDCAKEFKQWMREKKSIN